MNKIKFEKCKVRNVENFTDYEYTLDWSLARVLQECILSVVVTTKILVIYITVRYLNKA